MDGPEFINFSFMEQLGSQLLAITNNAAAIGLHIIFKHICKYSCRIERSSVARSNSICVPFLPFTFGNSAGVNTLVFFGRLYL